MTLTKTERERFAAWLDAEAASESEIVKQLNTLDTFKVLAQARAAEIHFMRHISRKLRSIEDTYV